MPFNTGFTYKNRAATSLMGSDITGLTQKHLKEILNQRSLPKGTSSHTSREASEHSAPVCFSMDRRIRHTDQLTPKLFH